MDSLAVPQGQGARYFAPTGLTGALDPSRHVGGTISGSPVTGTFITGDWVSSADGNFYICTAGGTPGTWVAVGTPAALNALAADIPTVGEVIPRREFLVNNTVAPTTGTMALAYFTAARTETINTLTVWSGATAASATPTLIRFGIYSIDGSGNGTLVASTANDTTLLAATNTVYAKALSGSWSKQVNTRYATAVLVVSGVGMPSYHGQQFISSAPTSVYTLITPPIQARVLSQADLPPTFTAAAAVGFQARIGMHLS